jgi:hypothetical protein
MTPRLSGVALCALFWGEAVGLCAAQSSQPPAGGDAAKQARQAAMERTIESLLAECEQFGDGDWSKWYDRLAPFREDVRKKVVATETRTRRLAGPWDGPTPCIEAAGDPPLYESGSDDEYLSDPGDLETWLKQREAPATIQRVAQWLTTRNIDLILVPVPKVGEIYPDRVSDFAPQERLVAPQFRKLILDLLKADVEVVDLLPMFLAEREEESAPLALPDDPHWSPRGQQIAATAILERLQRYSFVKTTLARPPLYKARPFTGRINGAWRAEALKPFQIQRLRNYTIWTGTQVLNSNGRPFQAATSSPVILMGDSYGSALDSILAPGTGMDALLAKGINLPVAMMSLPDNTVASIKDMLRNPDLINGCKVIVWLVRNSGIAKTDGWSLPALPNERRAESAK